jgi:hypothetical protein
LDEIIEELIDELETTASGEAWTIHPYEAKRFLKALKSIYQ